MPHMVILFSLDFINNIGDDILRDTTEYLIERSGYNGIISRCQLMPRMRVMPLRYKGYHFIGNVIKFFAQHFVKGAQQYKWLDIAYQVQYSRYFSSRIRQCDKVIYAIGMLKYSTQNLSYLFHLINRLANKYSKPVMMSAMSIEKKRGEDYRFSQLQDAVNYPMVKCITTRDGEDGLDRLKEFYLKSVKITDYVGDPALWIPECYNVYKSDNCSKIGINLIRGGIFRDYKEDSFSEQELLSFYVELVRELEERGFEWVMFCNGLPEDYAMGKRLLKELCVSGDKLLPPPNSGVELAEIVGGFKAVFGARLHSCITSVALGVPVSGLLWDNKLRYFAQTMGISQFFSTASELTGKIVADRIEDAIRYDFDFSNRDYYKVKTLASIRHFLVENS